MIAKDLCFTKLTALDTRYARYVERNISNLTMKNTSLFTKWSCKANGMLYVGAGLWDETSNSHTPVVIALDPSTGKVAWTMAMPVPSGHSRGFGAVRSVIADTRFCH